MGTIQFYGDKLGSFAAFLAAEGTGEVSMITPGMLRAYLLKLGQTHNRGGVRAHYRAFSAFLHWWQENEAPEGWPSPLTTVRPPKVPTVVLEPVPAPDIKAMVRTCERRTFFGTRDRAVLLALLDTGARAAEFVGIDMADVDLPTGQILIRAGKGGRPRVVFIGAKNRRSLVAYLRQVDDQDQSAALWKTGQGTRLTYSGLRELVRRRARRAKVPDPSLHSFRRAFALACLRNGMSVFALQRLMGHRDLTVLHRYLAQTTDDLRRAHSRDGPVDNLL